VIRHYDTVVLLIQAANVGNVYDLVEEDLISCTKQRASDGVLSSRDSRILSLAA